MAPGRGRRDRERTHHLTATANINLHVGRRLSRIKTSKEDSDFLTRNRNRRRIFFVAGLEGPTQQF
jgi:hypothetical protein